MGDKHFVASVGAPPGQYAEVEYSLGGRRWRTQFAPVAVARLTELQGADATILVTRQALDMWYQALAAELEGAGVRPEPVVIAEGRTEEERLAVVDALVKRVPAGAIVTLDVTFALRHLPFVYLAAMAYLVGLRGVRLEGVYYGAHQLRGEDGVAPIIELTSLVSLLEWYHVLQTVRDTGDFGAFARRLKADVGRLFQTGAPDLVLSRSRSAAEQLAAALSAGLPLEVGLAAARLRDALEGLHFGRDVAHAGRLALEEMRRQIESWSLVGLSCEKTAIPLDVPELKRQLRVARHYAEHRDLPKTLLLLREWVVNAALLAYGKADVWLDRQERERMARYLEGLNWRGRYDLLTDTQRPWVSLWKQITARRNALAHAGMNREPVDVATGVLERLIEQCEALLQGDRVHALDVPQGPRLLVAPLGLTPGALYSAVRCVTPDRLLVLTSAQARPLLAQALAHAGRADLDPHVIELADPHLGFLEVRAAIDGNVRRLLVDCREVVVSLTGGTTALQFGAEEIRREAERLGVPVRRIGLVDRRPRPEQEANPYVLGELLDLDLQRPDEET